jgi:hypothetical protein
VSPEESCQLFELYLGFSMITEKLEFYNIRIVIIVNYSARLSASLLSARSLHVEFYGCLQLPLSHITTVDGHLLASSATITDLRTSADLAFIHQCIHQVIVI